MAARLPTSDRSIRGPDSLELTVRLWYLRDPLLSEDIFRQLYLRCIGAHSALEALRNAL